MPAVDSGAKVREEGVQSELVSAPVAVFPQQPNRTFKVFNPEAPDVIRELQVQEAPVAGLSMKSLADVRVFKVTIDSKDGIRTGLYEAEVKELQDVLDLLTYSIEDGVAKFALTLSFRPATLVRSDGNSDGFVWSLPGAYIKPDSSSSINQTAIEIVDNKLGLVSVDGTLEFHAGSVFPNARTSSEQAHRRAMRVHPSPDIYSSGQGFSAQRVTKFFRADEIFSMFQSGKIKDLRVLDAICCFARNNPDLLTLPDKIFVDLSEPKQNASNQAVRDRILSKDQVQHLVENISALPHGIINIEIEEAKGAAPIYLQSETIYVTPVTNDGTKLETFAAQVVRPREEKFRDSFDCACICRIDGEDYVVVREAERIPIKARECAPHAIRGVFPPTNFEAIGGCCAENISHSDLMQQVEGYLNNNFGVRLAEGAEIKSIFSGYPSCGFNPQIAHILCCEIDPAGAKSWDKSVRLIRLQDYFELAEEGSIRNLSLNVALECIKTQLNHVQPEKLENNKDLRHRYLGLLDEGSKIHAWLTQDEGRREGFNALKKDPRFRHLVCLAENELGLLMAKLTDPEEKSFFSPTLPLYPVMSHRLGSIVAVLHFAHDLKHYAIGDYIPAALKEGEDPQVHYDNFVKMYHQNELIAGWYSDYVLPSILGPELSHEILGRHSLYDLFTECGITDIPKAKEYYSKMEVDGVIPEEIINHSNFEKFRATVIQSTLYAHVMFRSHAEAVYKNWMAHPLTSEIAARFSDRSFQDLVKQEGIFGGVEDQVRDYPEGINPLRAELSRTITRDLQLPVLRLACFAEKVQQENPDNQLLQKVVIGAFEEIDKIHKVYERIIELKSGVNGVEANDVNLAAFAELESLKAEEINHFKKFVEEFERDYLSQEDKDKVSNRIVPFYQKLPFVPKEEIMYKMQQLEQFSFQLAGIPAGL